MNSEISHSNKAGNPAGVSRFRRVAGRTFRYGERMLAIFGATVAIFWLTMDYSVIISPSMSPTLMGTGADNGDRVITEKVTGWYRTPRRWEVITFEKPTGERVMKRVVGLPGETVQITSGRELLIDGKAVELPPVLDRMYLRYGNLADGDAVPCGDGYYVLGDDLKDSEDSRFIGPVPERLIIGRAWMIVSPWERIGWVK